MNKEAEPTFWEHLDILRNYILQTLIVALGCGVLAFAFKEELFSIVLAPKDSNFVTYQWLGFPPFRVELINVGLTDPFMIHLKTTLYFALIGVSPYLLFQLYRFISPALYRNEQRCAVYVAGSGYAMFLIGMLVNYFLIFPLTVRFLGTYELSPEVKNMISMQSYIDTLLMMSLIFGVVFEIPVISWLLASFGLLRASWMKKYRRHAIVVILILAAIITPTADIFTLLIVSLPIWLLYEISIRLVMLTRPKNSSPKDL